MKLKLTLHRSDQKPVDLVATVDAATTVGDLAAYLERADPTGARTPRSADGSEPTLGLVADNHRALDPRLPVGESGLDSGATVSVTRSGTRYSEGDNGSAALATVVSGPDAGLKFNLHAGSNLIGRDRGCEIRLTDPLVSRQHARLNIGDVAEIIDLGSANGIALADAATSRTIMRAGDRVRLGDTELTVRVLRPPTQSGGTDISSSGFVRSPRLEKPYEGREFTPPDPPQRPTAQRFPIIPLLAPLVMGALLYLITHSLTSLAFVALSPLLMVGNAAESRISGRKAHQQAVSAFRGDLAALVQEAATAAETEVQTRKSELPSTPQCVSAAREASPLLWTRRPGEPGYGELRLGLGRQPSRSSFSMRDERRAPRDLYRELAAAAASMEFVDDVPIAAQPLQFGAVGLAGPRPVVLGVARAIIAQITSLHSPAELVLAALASTQSRTDWGWLKWLPHTTSPHSPLITRHLAATPTSATRLISELEELLQQRSGTDSDSDQPTVVLLVESDAPVDHARLVDLAETGWKHGIVVLWLAPDVALLPAACRTFVEVNTDATGTVGFVHTGDQLAPVAMEILQEAQALDFARSLSPLRDLGARIDDDSDLPRAVSLVALTGSQVARTPDAVIERWTENRSLLTGPFAPPTPSKHAGTLRAVIGQSAGELLALDLRADGPHALVGGTTGSGKSELLQSWILALAAAHSPQRLTFLLVDYKGGSAFGECSELPHTIGLVTDLSPHLVRRALTSLSAELRYREHLLAAHGAKDLVTLEKKGVLDAPPSLVIVIDEFAALVNEVPEFVDGIVNVAQRGRSLGLHLILATQRPAGVIKDNLRANTNLRLALRMADEADSTDVLGSPQAAFFDQAVPGRAVSKTGPGRLVPFQTGYAGGWTSDITPPPEILVEELTFGAGALWETPEEPETLTDPGPSDIRRLVANIGTASQLAEVPTPRKPWLAELQTIYDLSNQQEVPSRRRDDELVFGILDDPEHQAQPTVSFNPDQEGNLAVFGTGGSGKSTLLRTLAIAAGFTVRGGPCHVYGLDFGARGLAMLEELPHVGSIIAGNDHERIIRLLTWLRTLVDDRASRYSHANAGNITDYRAAAGAPDEPRILLLLDGVAAFRQAYEVGERSRWFDMLVSIATDGRQVGVHLLLSADRPAAIPSVLASAVQHRVVLRMADANDYSLMGAPADVLAPSSPPGRAVLGDGEVQVAILGSDPGVAAQAEMVRRFGESMVRAGASPAPQIERLSERVLLSTLPAQIDGQLVIGLSSDTLSPLGIQPQGTFLISGPSGSGRSSALLTVAQSMRRLDPTTELYHVGNPRSKMAKLPWWTGSFTGTDSADRLATLAATLALQATSQSTVAVFVENIAELASTAAEAALTDLVKLCLAENWLFVAEGETSTLSGSYGLLALAKSSRAGLALQPDSGDGITIFRTPFPSRLNRADFPPGRALLVGRGTTSVVQIGLPEDS